LWWTDLCDRAQGQKASKGDERAALISISPPLRVPAQQSGRRHTHQSSVQIVPSNAKTMLRFTADRLRGSNGYVP